MSLVCIPPEPDPFNLPPAWWGQVIVPSDHQEQLRLKVMAANGDGQSMVRFAAFDVEDTTVKWLRVALKYQKSEAERLLDYWMCALGLCEIRSADAVRAHMDKWISRASISRDDLYLSSMMSARMRNLDASGIRKILVEEKIRSILAKLESFAKDESQGKVLVCRILGQALSGDVEARYYCFESLQRIEHSTYSMYNSQGGKRLRELMRDGEWESSSIADEIRKARRNRFHPTHAALMEKAALDAADKAAKDEKSKAERQLFHVKCTEVEQELVALNNKVGNVCCVCNKNVCDKSHILLKKFTYARQLSNGDEVPHTVEVPIPRCEQCRSLAEEQLRLYEEDQQKRRDGKPKEVQIQSECRRMFKIVLLLLLLSPIAGWVSWGFWPFVGLEVLALIILAKASEFFGDLAKKRIRGLYRDIQKPVERYYLNLESVKMLFKKGYQEGVTYCRPVIRY